MTGNITLQSFIGKSLLNLFGVWYFHATCVKGNSISNSLVTVQKWCCFTFGLEMIALLSESWVLPPPVMMSPSFQELRKDISIFFFLSDFFTMLCGICENVLTWWPFKERMSSRLTCNGKFSSAFNWNEK